MYTKKRVVHKKKQLPPMWVIPAGTENPTLLDPGELRIIPRCTPRKIKKGLAEDIKKLSKQMQKCVIVNLRCHVFR